MEKKDWKYKQLGALIAISKGKKHDVVFDTLTGGAKRYIQIDDLRNNSNLKYTIESGVEVTPDDVIIAWDGANAGTIGFGLNGYIGSTLARLRILNAQVYPKFLGWFMRSQSASIREKCSGATIPHVNKSVLQSLNIPLPPLRIQKQIAAILEKADAARERRRKANKFTEQFLQSAFLEMFGDPVTNTKGWKTGILNDAIEYSEYGTSVKSNDEKRGCLVIGMSNVTYDGRIDFSVVKYVELPSDEYEKLKLRKGDVVFNRTNSTELVGKTAFWNSDIDAVVASYLVKLRVTRYFDPIWFSTLLNTASYKKLFMQRCKKAVGQSNISPTLLKEFPMYKPPLVRQQKFADLVEKVESMRTKQRESEKELENFFNSLMQRAFKGELKLEIALSSCCCSAGTGTRVVVDMSAKYSDRG